MLKFNLYYILLLNKKFIFYIVFFVLSQHFLLIILIYFFLKIKTHKKKINDKIKQININKLINLN